MNNRHLIKTLNRNLRNATHQHTLTKQTTLMKMTFNPIRNKTKITDWSLDCIISVSGNRGILRSKDVVFHQSDTDVEKLVDSIEHFTYVPETDEILVMLRGLFTIYRRPILTKGQLHFLLSFSCDSVVCMGHKATAYLVVVLKHCEKNNHRLTICSMNDTGCYAKLAQITDSFYV